MKKLIIEFIGTLFLVLVIGLTGNPLAIGAILMVMVYMGGHISGAMYNPAVSLAVMLRGKLSMSEMLQYWIAQIAGAVIGAGLCEWFKGEATTVSVGESYTVMQALVAEIAFTFALATVVLNVATARDNVNNSFYGLAIGFTVFASATAAGSISGGAFNPAVGLGHILFAGNWADLWIYFVGPLVGAAVAASVFRMTSTNDFE